MCFHAVVTFLDSAAALQNVDSCFRHLAGLFHAVPFCATFGVSCSGHFRENTSRGDFRPSPHGHLCILVDIKHEHIADLIRLVGKAMSEFTDADFKRIDHIFGPPAVSSLQVWEMRFGSSGCLDALGDEYYGSDLSIADNQLTYELSRKRCQDIEKYWEKIACVLIGFCRQKGYIDINIDARVRELITVWNASFAPGAH